jgi:hypothetical protein
MPHISLTRYIHSPWWKRRKQRYYRRHLKKCRVCGSKVQVQLHHLTYERMYQERDTDLVALCAVHHKQAHRAVDAGDCTLADSLEYLRRQRRLGPGRRRRVA